MTNINNSYKRFQNYGNSAPQNTFRQDYMEQHYGFEKKTLGEKREISEKKELSKIDKSFIERTTRLGMNSQGQFFKK